MKLKKLAPVLLLSTVAGTAFADGDDNGIYVGAGVGVESFTSDSFLQVGPTVIDITTPPTSVAADINIHQGDTAFAGVVYGGYGFDVGDLFDIDALEKFYLGLEFNAAFSSIESDADLQIALEPTISTLTAVSSSFKVDNSFGVSILPGFWLSEDVLAYLRGGFSWAHVESKILGAVSNDTKKVYRLGGQFGGGLEYGITENLNLRGEYIYTTYRSFDQEVPTAVINAAVGATPVAIDIPMNAHFNLNTSIATVSLNYRF